jgi:hypothetical protein
MLIVRCGIGGGMVLGAVVLIVSPSGLGPEGVGMAVGGGLAVLLLDLLYRIGVSGDLDRENGAAREYDEHGVWPGEEAGRRRKSVGYELRPFARTGSKSARAVSAP